MTSEHLQENETLAETLQRAQYQSLTRLVPVLYVVVIAATFALSLAFSGTAPVWLVNGLPILMLVGIAMRLRYWLAARALAAVQSQHVMRRDTLSVTIIGPAITLAFTLIGLGLLPFADTYQQSLAVVAIWITAIASAFCLSAAPRAAIAVVLSASIPLNLSFLWSGDVIMMVLAVLFVLVTGLIIHMLRAHYAGFAEMVQSRFELDEKQRSTESAREAAVTMAHTDYLTSLPNRRHFEQLLARRISDPLLKHVPFTVGLLDLDGFKPINDVHGHGVGDTVLFEVAARLTATMAGRGHVARMGGDEFAVLADGAADQEAALKVARDIRHALSRPYEIGPDEFAEMTCSIGLSLYPTSSDEPGRLLDQADLALYRAKSHRRGSASLFSPDQEDAALERSRIEQALRRAIIDKALTVNFQPIIDLESGRLTGFEALARWKDPVLGQVSPAVFIPIAEKAGLIEALTDDLLFKAASVAAGWPEGVVLSFNLSAEQLVKESAGLRIMKIIAAAGLPPHRFEAEVTETALMNDLKAARRTIEALKAAGVMVSLDDFGTGYSSLSQIKDLPLDKVKIDKSFVDQIVTDSKMASLVKAIISMCDTLELRCVAEGIEEDAQLDALKLGGCASGQGYLFSRPIPVEEIRALIERQEAVAREREQAQAQAQQAA